jgi:hypothetical protein
MMAKHKMIADIQSLFEHACGSPMRAGICADQNYYKLKASGRSEDLNALKAECTPKNRRACLNLAKYYSESGKAKDAAPILKELCEESQNKFGCPGFPNMDFFQFR